MEPKDQYHRYSLTDIERYLQGRLSPAEMHAMEKAALQDPFLADALEGFSGADMITAQNDLVQIRKELTAKEEHRIIPFIVRKTYTWRIAAAVVFIVAGIGSWLLFFNNRQSTSSLALHKDSAVVKNDSIEPVTAAVTKPDSMDIAAATVRAETESRKAAAMREKERLADKHTNEAALAMLEQSLAKTQQAPLSAPVKISGRSSAKIIEITGRITDSLNQPVASATVQNLDLKTIIATDQNGEFKMYGLDSSANRIRVSALGFQQVDTVSAYNRNTLAIRMKPSNEMLNEVVVTTYGQSRKKSAPAPPAKQPESKTDTAGYANNIAAARPSAQPGKDVYIKIRGTSNIAANDSASTPEPAGGWDSLKQNIRSIAKREELGLPANFVKVTAGLTLNRRGSARKVDILYLSFESLKPAIVEALKAVPAWYLNGKKQTGPVVVNLQF